ELVADQVEPLSSDEFWDSIGQVRASCKQSIPPWCGAMPRKLGCSPTEGRANFSRNVRLRHRCVRWSTPPSTLNRFARAMPAARAASAFRYSPKLRPKIGSKDRKPALILRISFQRRHFLGTVDSYSRFLKASLCQKFGPTRMALR